MGSLIRKDEDGWYFNADLILLYMIVLIAIIVGAVKAIRWAVES